MPASRRISYEVHVQRGSRWETYARYGADGQGGALFRARCLVRHPLVDAVRVIKEVYDPISGKGQEYVVFKTRNDRQTDGQDSSQVSQNGMEAAMGTAGPSLPPSGTEKPRISQGTPSVRALADILTGWSLVKKCGAAAIFAALAAALLTLTTHLISIETSLATAPFGQLTGFGGFVLATALIFIFCAIPVVFITSGRKPTAYTEPSDDLLQNSSDAEAADGFASTGFSLANDAPDTPLADTPPPALELAENRSVLIDFMQEGMDYARGEHDLSDNFVRFGINLYLAGAAEHLAQTRDLDPDTTSLVVSGCAKSLGSGTAQAESFARRYVEYLMADSRSMDMFIAGREAMAACSTDAEGSMHRLAEALVRWAQPSPSESRSGSLAIMCAAPAEDHRRLAEWADRPAMEVVRKHNATLVEFAQKFDGKEVESSVSVMTIVFPEASAAVKAACAVFKHLLAQQTSESHDEVPLRIGINVAESTVRGQKIDDAAVRLAARICESAEGGQILASKAVFNSCAGSHGLPAFSARGRYILKGYGESIPLYEAIWRESAGARQHKVPSVAPDSSASTPERPALRRKSSA